jgi:NAD(P)-dependent dehydrogenase (short-subunit alcohol dehydrogenase family)
MTPTNDALGGRVALVTGASRGIGAAVARAFSRAGAAVALAARDGAALDRLATELNEAGGQSLALPTDVTDADAVARLVDQTVSAFGRLDFACNSGGRWASAYPSGGRAARRV